MAGGFGLKFIYWINRFTTANFNFFTSLSPEFFLRCIITTYIPLAAGSPLADFRFHCMPAIPAAIVVSMLFTSSPVIVYIWIFAGPADAVCHFIVTNGDAVSPATITGFGYIFSSAIIPPAPMFNTVTDFEAMTLRLCPVFNSTLISYTPESTVLPWLFKPSQEIVEPAAYPMFIGAEFLPTCTTSSIVRLMLAPVRSGDWSLRTSSPAELYIFILTYSSSFSICTLSMRVFTWPYVSVVLIFM